MKGTPGSESYLGIDTRSPGDMQGNFVMCAEVWEWWMKGIPI